jgi:hypothetical protein
VISLSWLREKGKIQMKARYVLAVALTLITLLAAVGPASAAAQPVISNYWIDLSGGSLNPCTNEWVEMTGSVHIVYSVVEHQTGDYTLTEHSNMIVSGVGQTTGANYLFRAASNEHSTVAFDGAPFVYTDIYRYQSVTPGAFNNDVYWQSYHITVNADGTVSSELDDSGWECR